jgi:HAD superfamily hydrolase (TIGR01509 family)
MKFHALLFDFDGLILDTEAPDYECWREVYQEHGHELPFSLWCDAIGKAASEFDPRRHLSGLTGAPISQEIQERRRFRYLERVNALTPLPGVRDYLNEAKRLGLKIGLATSSSEGWAIGHLSRLGLDVYFDSIKCAADVRHAKPHPELYLSALRALGAEAREAVAFEDSPNGVTAAKSAGIRCVAVPNPLTQGLPLDHADLRLSSLRELSLPDLLSQMERVPLS